MPTAAPAATRSRDSRALLPSPALPLLHFAAAHFAFALACAALALDPALAGGFHYRPKVVALVHLVTLGWISGSILGAWYIVGPLAFGVPLRAGVADGLAAAAFWLGTAGMAGAFWTGRYDLIAHAAPLVLVGVVIVGTRVAAGLVRSRVPWGVSLHVLLAFANVLLAGLAGMAIAWARAAGTLTLPPQAVALAHGHAAVLGWAAMMIVGVSYRLVPMFLPAAMPRGHGLAVSAILLEIGAVGLTTALALGGTPLPWTIVVTLGFAAFFWRVRAMLGSRRPRPVELPRPDWSTWQTHVALLALFVTLGLGFRLGAGGASPSLTWAYGVIGLVGFAAQMVVGIQGRLLPMHAWYRGLQRGPGLPRRSVHRLADPRLARAVLLGWVAGLPLLTVGLATARPGATAAGAGALLAATLLNAWLAIDILRSGIETTAGAPETGGEAADGPGRDDDGEPEPPV
jgi:hypothetical protein